MSDLITVSFSLASWCSGEPLIAFAHLNEAITGSGLNAMERKAERGQIAWKCFWFIVERWHSSQWEAFWINSCLYWVTKDRPLVILFSLLFQADFWVLSGSIFYFLRVTMTYYHPLKLCLFINLYNESCCKWSSIPIHLNALDTTNPVIILCKWMSDKTLLLVFFIGQQDSKENNIYSGKFIVQKCKEWEMNPKSDRGKHDYRV